MPNQLSLSILSAELGRQIRLFALMDDNNLLLHTLFHFRGTAPLLLFAAKQEEFTFYFPLRLRDPSAAPPAVDWKAFPDAPPKTQPSKSVEQFLADFDFSLVGFANSFSVYKYRYAGNFPEEVRLKLIAADLKSRLHAVSASTEAGKQMARRFTFYDIAKLENLDLESKKALLFGKKIVDAAAEADSSPPTRSLAELAQEKETPVSPQLPQPLPPAPLPPSARKPSDKQRSELVYSAEKPLEAELKREDFLLTSPPSNLPKGSAPRRFHGTIKVFFDDEKYGFLESPDYGQDVYVSLDELKKAGATKKIVRKNRAQPYTFVVHEYTRKGKPARKAVDIKMEVLGE